MANANKRRGDRAELEVQALLREHLGVPARRALGAGRKDDVGDIHGVPNTAVSVTANREWGRMLREKPIAVEKQRENRGADHAATFVRLIGGDYRVVLTPEQWFALWREAQ